VHPCCNDDSLLLLIDLIWHPVGDGEVLALVAGDGPAQDVPGHVVELAGLDLAQVVVEVGVGVGLRVGKVDDIVVELEGVSEGEGVVATLEVGELRRVLLVVVLEVAQVFTTTIPTLLELTLLLAGGVGKTLLLHPVLALL
jgi:hypothetical protein